MHASLQIRTYKHRCFVSCLGHTSLTCVPGIGKKNKRLLNRSGIDNLSELYEKYRRMNNCQRFKSWLECDIGFTSYQAKMATCGISSKLREHKPIDTGLKPIHCSKRDKQSTHINMKNRTCNELVNNDEQIMATATLFENDSHLSIHTLSSIDSLVSEHCVRNRSVILFQ
jgi:hypothetical protein